MHKLILPLFALLCQSCSSGPQLDSFGNEIIDTKYVHRYGMEIPLDHWEEAGQNGQVVNTTKEGRVCSETYFGGCLEGETTYTFPFSNEIEKSQHFSQGQVKKEISYFRNGQPRQEIDFSSEEISVKEWYENGVLKSLEKKSGDHILNGEYYNPKQQCISTIENGGGVRTSSNAYGELMATDHYVEGKLAYQTLYYSNNSPKEIITYNNGVIDGVRKTFYPGGEPKTIEIWKDGKQEGMTTVYVDGIKAEEVFYVNGLKNGKALIYGEGNKITQEISWKNGLLHGPSHTYVDGHISTEWYLKGQKVPKAYYDTINRHG